MSVFKKKGQKKRKPQPKKVQATAPKAPRQQWIPPFPGVGKRRSSLVIDDSNPISEAPKVIAAPPTYTLPPPPATEPITIPEAPASPKPEKKTVYLREQKARKEFLRVFRQLTYRWRSWDIWTDFVTMIACTISNAVDTTHFDEREAAYLRAINKYNKDEQALFPELFAHLVMALEENPEQDFLGDIYTELGLNSKEHEQVFTPYNVAHMMAEITIGDVAKQVEEHGFVTIHDCCCGGGVTLIAAANVAKSRLEKVNLNYQNHVLVTGQDIDYVVAMMCYIQTSLLGIAGYFKVGNALTDPMSDDDNLDNYWFTPMYFFPVWHLRRLWRRVDKLIGGAEMDKFELGQLVVTDGVNTKMKADPGFDAFVKTSLGRFKRCDWGTLCDEDKAECDKAVKNGDQMIMGAYARDGEEIWIITEWNHSATTILFPHER